MVDEELEPTSAELTASEEAAFWEALSQRSSIIQDGFSFWNSLREGQALPRRDIFDPFDVPKLMPHIVLLDVQDNPTDFKYRVIGTFVSEHLAENWTGFWMSEIEHQKSPSRIWESCEHVAVTRNPLLSRIPYVGPHADFLYGEDIILPLVDEEDKIVNLLVFVSYIRKE
ncbi:MAG: hypothetical protein CMM52_00275 [Rhodospirillaceae bacterium]|nr:hypothetical protein [Rhodospirillaceae bacterium]|tara:strand:+ start:983 stop:1492 length:510 start_codon:yes stop_codon:yes gene_type:complete